MNARTGPGAGMRRAGGIAALYVAGAYLAAIPYFVLLVDYPSATDPASKVALHDRVVRVARDRHAPVGRAFPAASRRSRARIEQPSCSGR